MPFAASLLVELETTETPAQLRIRTDMYKHACVSALELTLSFQFTCLALAAMLPAEFCYVSFACLASILLINFANCIRIAYISFLCVFSCGILARTLSTLAFLFCLFLWDVPFMLLFYFAVLHQFPSYMFLFHYTPVSPRLPLFDVNLLLIKSHVSNEVCSSFLLISCVISFL